MKWHHFSHISLQLDVICAHTTYAHAGRLYYCDSDGLNVIYYALYIDELRPHACASSPLH